MVRRKTKQQGKNDANTGKVLQEVAKDKSSLKSVRHDDHLNRWQQCLQDLPLGTIIDIPYLKQLAIKAEVPVVYCSTSDLGKVKNFVPAYLHRFTTHMWQLVDEEDGIISQHYWDEGDDSILNLFGTYIQHPEETFLQYFGSTPVAAFEQGSTRRSPRKNPNQGSPIHSPTKYPDVIGEQPEKSSQLKRKSGPAPGEEDVIARRVSTRPIVLTDEDPQKLAEEINAVAAATVATPTVTAVATNTATMEMTAVATTAAVTTAASNNTANPRLNVQAHTRKTNP